MRMKCSAKISASIWIKMLRLFFSGEKSKNQSCEMPNKRINYETNCKSVCVLPLPSSALFLHIVGYKYSRELYVYQSNEKLPIWWSDVQSNSSVEKLFSCNFKSI